MQLGKHVFFILAIKGIKQADEQSIIFQNFCCRNIYLL